MRIIYKILLTISILFSPIIVNAQEMPQPKEISIGVLEFNPLFYMEDGELKGFYTELLERVMYDLNIDYRFEHRTGFSDLYSNLLENEIDIFAGLLRTKEREDLFYWPEQPLRNYYSTLYSSHENVFESPEELKDRKIGFIENEASGTLFRSLMQNFNISYEPRYYPCFNSLVEAIKNEEIYAFVASSAIRFSEEHDIHQSNFVFSPLNAYVSTSISNDEYAKEVADRISNRINELKRNEDSYYYSLHTKYYEEFVIEQTPVWLITASIILSITIIVSFFLIRILTRKLRKTNNALKKLNNNLEEKIKVAAREMADMENLISLGKLTATISHEINTPIGVAYTSSTLEQHKIEILEEKYRAGELNEEELYDFFEFSKDTFKLLVYNLERAAELVQKLRSLSADQTLPNEIKDFEVPQFFENIWESVKLTYKNKNVKLHLDCDTILFKGAKPSRMYQTTVNYMINSFEHGFKDRDSGNIYITLKVNEDNDLYWCYEDDGVGIPEELLERVWEPFFTTKEEIGNTGLGMSIIYNILTSFNAKHLKLENREGGGFKVSYVIPISGRKRTLTKENEKYIIE